MLKNLFLIGFMLSLAGCTDKTTARGTLRQL